MAKISTNYVDFLKRRDYFPKDAVNQRSQLFQQLQTKTTYHQKDLRAHFGCVNAIDFSNDGELMISGGDDRRVLLWNVQKVLHPQKEPTPISMKGQHNSNIFTLAFDSTKRVIFSGGNDDNVILHDTTTGDPLNIYLHERPVYCVSIDPECDSVFTSACDDGRILVFDTRNPNEFELAVNTGPFHAVMYNPCEPRLVATANSKDGIALWDTRKPKEMLMQYGSCESCMSIRFNKAGTQLLALRRRLPPVLYNTHSSQAVAQFDHEGYYNSCTMKSCCFAGPDDEYVVSGSDDFVLYMWRVPCGDNYGQWVKSAEHTLEGHRSIVNQVRYNEHNCLLASSGVEKIVKLWSPLPLEVQVDDSCKESLAASSRKVYTHEDYIRLILRNGETFMNHDYSLQSTNEDPRMMAFFDSLVQREIEGWSPSEDSSSDTTRSPPRRPYYDYVQGSPSTSSTSSDEEIVGPEAFRRSPRNNEPDQRSDVSPSSDVSTGRNGLDASRRTNSSSSTLNTSSSSHNHSPSVSNGMILFLTDAALESSDTTGLQEVARTILEDSLARSSPTPTTSNTKNPIKELIAQKRDRLMRLALTTPEKRKRKQKHRFHRKLSVTHASTSEDEQQNEDWRNVASTSNGIRRKRKLSQTETPDSGIASDSRSNNRSTSHVRYKGRNYRHLLRDSSSSSSEED